jgi:hypothetical protein
MRERPRRKRQHITTTISEEDQKYCVDEGIPYFVVVEKGMEALKRKLPTENGEKSDINVAKFEKIVSFSHDLNEKLIRAEAKYLELYDKYRELLEKTDKRRGAV